jgi:hypothetical protein
MNGMMRTIGRLAAVGAAALLLTGSAVAAVEARPKIPPGGTRAGSLYTLCVSVGGDPFYFEIGPVWSLSCEEEGGQTTLHGGIRDLPDME